MTKRLYQDVSADRLQEISDEIEKLDEVGRYNKLYCEVSKLYLEASIIHMQVIEDMSEQFEMIKALMFDYLEEIGHANEFTSYMNSKIASINTAQN